MNEGVFRATPSGYSEFGMLGPGDSVGKVGLTGRDLDTRFTCCEWEEVPEDCKYRELDSADG